MTALLVGAALLVAAALGLLLRPLLKNGRAASGPDAEPPHLQVLREQAAQLQADQGAGLLNPEQLAAARTELARRVLEEDQAGAARAHLGNGRATAWLLALAVPLLVAGLYARLGQPEALQARTPASGGEPTASQIEAMVNQMAMRLESAPPEQANDPAAWAMLARSLAALQRLPEADRAFTRAIALAPRNAQLLADRADLVVLMQGPQGRAQSNQLIAQALQIDPNHLKALALAGSAAMERQDWPAAIAYLERASRVVPAGSEFAAELQASAQAARAAAGLPPVQPQALAQAAPAAAPSASAAAALSVSGSIDMAPALRAAVPPGSTLFVFARAVNGPRAPLAVMRVPVGSWPVSFKLDDSMAMSPELRLSQFEQVQVQARVSPSGQAMPQAGDWVGQLAPVKPGGSGLKLVIDRVQP
jgi:cytochrome c-type biogenesis protein CcmH